MPPITVVGVDEQVNSPGINNAEEAEGTADIDVAGSAAPGASIVVYLAPYTEQGWVDVVTTAIYDTVNRPSVLSVSWGNVEISWTAQAMHAINQAFQEAAAMGVTVLAASGDNGSSCGYPGGRARVHTGVRPLRHRVRRDVGAERIGLFLYRGHLE